MDCSQAVVTLFLLVPCDQGGGHSTASSMDLAIAEALAAPGRIAADRAQDPLRRPDLVLAFFEIRPGMTVLDLFSGGGYYTEIVSRVVGNSGTVVAHNNDAYLAFAREGLAGRYDGDRLPNVERVIAEADALELGAARFDAALALLTWHDFYYVDAENGWPEIDEAAMVSKLCAALKPGAVLGVTDHVAAAGSEPTDSAQTLHRIDPQRIKDDLVGDCFAYEGEISALRNPADDLDLPMSADGIRGRTDRVVYKFRRKEIPD
jgi:predicted methyltransferase